MRKHTRQKINLAKKYDRIEWATPIQSNKRYPSQISAPTIFITQLNGKNMSFVGGGLQNLYLLKILIFNWNIFGKTISYDFMYKTCFKFYSLLDVLKKLKNTVLKRFYALFTDSVSRLMLPTSDCDCNSNIYKILQNKIIGYHSINGLKKSNLPGDHIKRLALYIIVKRYRKNQKSSCK